MSFLFNAHHRLNLYDLVGTCLRYQPGFIVGGVIEHDSNPQRSIGYYLEPLLMLVPFAKRQIRITLTGATHGPDDPSVIRNFKYYCIPGNFRVAKFS